MAFPISFVAGAVIGAVATYVMKDDSAKTWVVDTSKKLKDQTDAYITSVKEKRAAKKAEEEAAQEARAAEAAENVVEGAKAAAAA